MFSKGKTPEPGTSYSKSETTQVVSAYSLDNEWIGIDEEVLTERDDRLRVTKKDKIKVFRKVDSEDYLVITGKREKGGKTKYSIKIHEAGSSFDDAVKLFPKSVITLEDGTLTLGFTSNKSTLKRFAKYILKDQERVRDTLNEVCRFMRFEPDSRYPSGMELLYDALEEGNPEKAREALKKGANINASIRHRDTPLFEAISDGNVEMVQLLLELGADISKKYSYGSWRQFNNRIKPLMYAIMCLQDDPTGTHHDVFRLLITEYITKKIKPVKRIIIDAMFYMLSNKYPTQLMIDVILKLFSTGIPLDVKNSFGDTPLTRAAAFGSMELVEMLLSAGANVHEADNAGQTAWFNARVNDNKEMQELILSRVCASPSLAVSTLFDAVKFDDLDTVKYLVSRGVDPCEVLSMGSNPFKRDCTSLTNACSSQNNNFSGKIRIVSYLIELFKHKNQLHLLNKTSDDETPLMMVVNYDVRISGYTRGTRSNTDTATPDEIAEKLTLVKLLLEAGAKPDLPDCWNNTPLMAAVYNNEFDCVQALLTAKANSNAKNNVGLTPLMLAAEAADIRIVQALIKAGAKLDAKDNNGDTALIAAADLGNLDAVNTLIAAGASIETINEDGDSARDRAQFHGHEGIVKALEAAAARPSIKKLFGRLFSHSNDENSRNGSSPEAGRKRESDFGFDF